MVKDNKVEKKTNTPEYGCVSDLAKQQKATSGEVPTASKSVKEKEDK